MKILRTTQKTKAWLAVEPSRRVEHLAVADLSAYLLEYSDGKHCHSNKRNTVMNEN
jgi:hypothetical protein